METDNAKPLPATEWQKRIYLGGFAGRKPAVPVGFENLQAKAQRVMSPAAFAYVAGGAGIESTIRANREAFESVRIIPRMLCDVGERSTKITLFGKELPAPILLSPIGVLELAHREADLAVARAAAGLGVPMIFSNQASFPMETCAAVMTDSPRWFQLYWSKSDELVASFLDRAERCGCSAVVVTLDTTLLGWRTRDLELAYLPFLEGRGIAQYTSDPVFQKLMDEPDDSKPPEREISYHTVAGLISMVRKYPGRGFLSKLRSGRPVTAVRKFVDLYSNPGITWDRLGFLRKHTQLPILLKGILHPDDARKAVDHGLDGVIVSNHGGRQVDGSIGTFEALPAVVDAVAGRMPVLLDGGVRCGADIFKSLAMGATAVCIGRPYVYGLALAGQRGVEAVLQNLLADFELTMGLAGCKSPDGIARSCLNG